MKKDKIRLEWETDPDAYWARLEAFTPDNEGGDYDYGMDMEFDEDDNPEDLALEALYEIYEELVSEGNEEKDWFSDFDDPRIVANFDSEQVEAFYNDLYDIFSEEWDDEEDED